MSRTSGRLARVALKLTPQQAVCRWLIDAHAHGSMVAYAQSLPPTGPAAHPLTGLAERVEAAVRAALRGRPEERAQAAVRQAVADTGFLYFLHHRLNVRVVEALPALAARLALLLEQAQGLARDDLARLRLGEVARQLGEALPYPLMAEDAAAVTAALGGWVEPWEELLGEDGAVAEWVGAAYVAEGRVVLPWDAYGQRPGHAWLLPGPEPVASGGLRELFTDDGSWAEFEAGRDYTHGFADVRDAELASRVNEVGVALRNLVATGELVAGTMLALPEVPQVVLAQAPLAEGGWLDRTVAELAVWGGLLAQHGLAIGDADDSPLAWGEVRDGDGEPLPLPLCPAAVALQAAARARLARFSGRTAVVGGRSYVHAEAFLAWRRRARLGPGDAERRTGLVLAPWNGWVTGHGGAGRARLAGVPVQPLTPWLATAPLQSCATEADAAAALAVRVRTLHTLRAVVDDEDWAARCRRAVEEMVALRADVGRLQRLVAHVSRQRYGGQPVLYPDLAEQLEALTEAQGDMDRLLRAVVARGAAGTHAAQEGAAREVRDVGGRDDETLARADALWLVGEQEDAQTLVARVLAE